ncbi:MAG TPA: hypothetical protein VN653_16715 [Anaerolineales bacterium]|nr:hypothetical protein [Anaerolineales bacterium]
MKVETVAAIFETIAVIGVIMAGLLGNSIAAIVMGALVLFVVVGYLVWKVFSLSKENNILRDSLARKTRSVEVRQFYEGSISISASQKNNQHIAADFIQWDECTLMLWVYIPQQGEGLRDANKNRCLFSHTTGHTEAWADFNGFTLRHNDNKHWHFSFSDDQARHAPQGILIEDGLEPGWHHFLIQWDKLKPELRLLIDKGICGNARLSTFLSYWPEKNADNITIGSWETGAVDTYCETKLLSLWICNKYLEIDDELLSMHYSKQP